MLNNQVSDPVKTPLSSSRIRIIYCYSNPSSADHVGLVKVGMTTAPSPSVDMDIRKVAEGAAHKRIREASASRYNLEWVEVSPDFKLQDYRVHKILEGNGVRRKKFTYSDAREWFETTPEKAHEAYRAAVEGVVTIESKKEHRNIVLRPEQVRFIENTFTAWKGGASKRLWDAKMRFGKTLVAYSFIDKAHKCDPSRMRRVLVLTHRPVVNKGWSDEYETILHKEGWQYGSKDAKHKGLSELDPNEPFVYFVSMQDARGKMQSGESFKETNKEIFETHWDLVIVDEAHEGNVTDLAQQVHASISRSFTLNLSGTPFKYLANGDFNADEMDSWDYVDEQKAKNAWEEENEGVVSDVVNPYGGLARMWINVLDIRPIVKNSLVVDEEVGSFNFQEFFKVEGGKFKNGEDIVNFLDTICEVKRNEGNEENDKVKNVESVEVDNIAASLTGAGERVATMPFAPMRQDFTRHSLWVLPSVESCKLLVETLRNHSVFKNYTVVNVAGSDTSESKNALGRVLRAIGDSPDETKTITLTVGRLTTGVTVPPWTTVLMLNNTTSAEAYMQTIFRVQSPHEYKGKVKTECAVYDFAPDRALKVLVDVAGVSSKAGVDGFSGRRAVLGEMLNYLPVISLVDNHDMKRLDAGGVMREVKRVYTNRVVNNGFDSDFLFTKELEKLPPDLRELLEDVRQISSKTAPSIRQPVDSKVVISANNFDEAHYDNETLQEEVKKNENKKTLTPEEEEQLRRHQEELKQRSNMRAVLRTVSVRIPIMLLALMADVNFKEAKLSEDFELSDLTEKLDNESWKEFFGGITKEMFLKLGPAFDKEVLQVSASAWVEEVDEALALRDVDLEEFMVRVETFMGKLRNPNKETVLTPYRVVKTMYTSLEEQLVSGELSPFAQDTSSVKGTLYDINVKSGLFPLYGAYLIKKSSPNLLWEQVCEDYIFANSRTYAGKWITATLLGVPKDWENITVIDVCEELKSTDVAGLSEQSGKLFLNRFLLSPLNAKRGMAGGRIVAITDIEERGKIVNILQRFDQQVRLVERDGSMSDKRKASRKAELLEQVKKELDASVTFDSIVSNPPYQISDGGGVNESSAIPIYHIFVRQAISLNPKFITMITPSRWFVGGKGLDAFREEMLKDNRLESIVDYPNANECFPGVEIKGGVGYFIWNRERNFSRNGCAITNVRNGVKNVTIRRPLNQYDVLIRENEAVTILDKVKEKTDKFISAKVASHKPFGFRSNFEDFEIQKNQKNNVKIYLKEKKIGWVKANQITKNLQVVGKWKVLTPKAATGDGKIPNSVISYSIVAPPNSCCSETYLLMGTFESEEEATRFSEYMKTRFFRFMLSLRKITQNMSQNSFAFVPDLPMNKTWTDAELYEKYNLTAEEISFIEGNVKEML